ncbi:hypothetical protein J6590_016337 [Homalodisca vitripennis]|nr:hypothetical protein J6590_016337 [Homalodisca vitripennis]
MCAGWPSLPRLRLLTAQTVYLFSRRAKRLADIITHGYYPSSRTPLSVETPSLSVPSGHNVKEYEMRWRRRWLGVKRKLLDNSDRVPRVLAHRHFQHNLMEIYLTTAEIYVLLRRPALMNFVAATAVQSHPGYSIQLYTPARGDEQREAWLCTAKRTSLDLDIDALNRLEMISKGSNKGQRATDYRCPQETRDGQRVKEAHLCSQNIDVKCDFCVEEVLYDVCQATTKTKYKIMNSAHIRIV